MPVSDRTRSRFVLPNGVIYLDGNSLGPLTHAARDRIARETATMWGQGLIGSWNAGWMELPERVGDRIAPLIGAGSGSVTVADSTSINLYKVLMAATAATARRVILSDTGNFPTDIYVAQGVAEQRGMTLRLVAPEAAHDAIDDSVAVLMLTQVDYRTGRLHDLPALTARAYDAGAVVIWDLAHSAGALPVDVAVAGADYAVGCGYKFLNGGPGAPAFVYVRPDHAASLPAAIQGWMGHADPFAFGLDYKPRPDIHRLRVGTPPILSLAALDAALDVWDGVSIDDVRADAIALSEAFIVDVEARCGGRLVLASPRDANHRGSQVSFRHPQGYAVMQALIARGVIGDFRAPDILRFGITPLYTTGAELAHAAAVLADVLETGAWNDPKFHQRARVT